MGRIPEQDHLRRERSRAALVQAALELFAEQGYRSTTIAEVAQRAGLSKGLVYHYFDDKHALLEAVLLERVQQLKRWVDERPQASEREQLDAFARAAVAWVQREPAQMRLYLRALTDDETREMAGRIVSDWVQPQSGELRLFRASLLGILTLAAISPVPPPLEPLVERLLEQL